MNPLRPAAALAALAVAVAAAIPTWLPAQSLTERDLRVGGLPVDADTSAVRRVLGNPIGIRPYRDADGRVLIAWRYPGLTVSVGLNGRAYTWQLSGARFATTRGVRPGEFTSRVRSAYGLPSVEYPHNILYSLQPEGRSNTLGIDFYIVEGVVRTVSVGHVVSVPAHTGRVNPQPN